MTSMTELYIFFHDSLELSLFSLLFLVFVLLIFPTRWIERKLKRETPAGQINEKNLMFSRNLLKPGSVRYREYYSEFPDHEEPDNNFRLKPGLLSEDAALYLDNQAFRVVTLIRPGVVSIAVFCRQAEIPLQYGKSPAE
jgi:hypothetical protein